MREAKSIALNILIMVMLLSPIFRYELTTGNPATIVVPDDFSTIQEAINNATDGDTVLVKAGTYYEHVVVNKTLYLTGESCSTTIVDGNWTGVVINVTRDDVIVTGLTVQRSGSTYWENAGILLGNVGNCSISGNILTENSFAGLELNHSRGCSISGNSIHSNGGVGMTLVGGSLNDLSRNSFVENGWSALTLNDDANNNTISENNMTSNNLAVTGHCINLYRSSNNSIYKNRIADDDNGIRLEYWSNFNTISRNDITGNTLIGVSVERYSDNNTISGNTITGGSFGVSISNSRYTGICGNAIAQTYGSDIEAGVYLESADYTRIYENEITDNWRSILVYASSPYVSVHGNNVTGNEHGIAVARGGSNYCNVSENYVANNRAYGIALTGLGGASNYATVERNLVVNNTQEGVGIGQGSSHNMIIQNNIVGNGYGIYIDLFGPSTQNRIFNNNIAGNTLQVSTAPDSVNVWDDGYPSGGNYWSDYNGSDCRNGPDQNLAGCDGIGDTPNVIDSSNRDNYPLMKPIPWDSDDIGVTCLGKVGSQGVSSMKTIIAEGTVVHFGVFVMNYGNDTEIFNVTTYINATLLETQTGITISSKGYAIVNFTWNTSSFEKGNYTITVQATAVPGETDAGDNSLVWAVAVGVVGDVDNNGIVDMLDVYKIALDFGAIVGQAHYVSNCDIDDNGVINMLDLYITAIHYGQKDPTSRGGCCEKSVNQICENSRYAFRVWGKS